MSDPAPEEHQTREAGAPFDALNADVILRSIDGVDFRTTKSYLTRALHGLGDILQAGHLNGIGGVEEQQNGVLVIPLPETSAVLDLFLRTLYPAELDCPPLSSKLNLMAGVCKALNKYCVKSFPLAVSDALMLAAKEEPELVYAIACRYASLAEVTKAAARNTLKKPRRLDNLGESDIADISSLQYHAIGQYQIACRIAAVEACEPPNMRSMPSDTPGARTIIPSQQDAFHKDCSCPIHWEHIQLQECYGPPDEPVDVDTHECRYPVWLYEYLYAVRHEVLTGDTLCGEVAMTPMFLGQAIAAGKECPSCGTGVGVAEFIGYAQRLSQWIDDALDCVAFQSTASAA
ncbi:unnamed protein product [Peniophora sp. CBMAI 1063]|nr:unnamed protein product [Peniophora sp. CBMAI 1063]